MKTITNGEIELTIENTEKTLQVILAADQYHYQSLERLKPFLLGNEQFLEGQIEEVTDEQLTLSYIIPEHAEKLSDAVLAMDELERFSLARTYSSFFHYQVQVVTPFMHPDNLFLVAGTLAIAHRGLSGVLEPKNLSYEEFLKQYKALVLFTVQPKTKFEQLVTGKSTLRDKFSQEILECENVEAIEELLHHQYQVLKQTKISHEKSVKKSYYTTFRVCAILFAIIAVGLGVYTGVVTSSTVPLQSRIIESQSDFINNNFDGATSVLSNDNPNSLPKSAQYVLAASFVHRDTLSAEQKDSILSNLSISSPTNELMYWIEIGQGNLNSALNIAQNIGDNQLILHTYTELYDTTYANTTMSGSQKQSLLNQYMSKIKEYNKLLGGSTNVSN